MSEYERLLHERRHTHDAKREARRLKGAPASVHPWIEVAHSKRAREQEDHAEVSEVLTHRSRTGRRVTRLLVGLIVATGIALFAASFTPRDTPAGAPERLQVTLWHSLAAPEATLLQEYTHQHMSDEETIESIEFIARNDLEQALRVALLRGHAPDVAIVTASAASHFASVGMTQPFAPLRTDEGAPSYITLGDAIPWTEALVAVRLRTQLSRETDVALTRLFSGLAVRIAESLHR